MARADVLDILGLGPQVREALADEFDQKGGIPHARVTHYVDGTNGSDGYGGESWDRAKATIQAAVTAASTSDRILIAPGSYDEEVTVATAGLTLIGVANRGSVAIAPTGANVTALTVNANSCTVVNMGLEGDGTGGGVHVAPSGSDIRRFRAYGCKLEGGAFALQLQSDASNDVADTIIQECELAWTTDAVLIDVTGGGNPVTNTYIRNCLLHNFSSRGIRVTNAHTSDLWVVGNVFSHQENAVEPTNEYLDLDQASTSGFIANNVFATTVFSTAKFALAAGVIFANNITEQENPSAGQGGTSGRPD